MRRTAPLCLALLASVALFHPAGAQEANSPQSGTRSDPRAAIPDLEGFAPSNVPEQLEEPKEANVTITGHVLEPTSVMPTPERLEALQMPEGFSIRVFARDLGNPRMIDVSDDGTVYVTDRKAGTVTMMKDGDGDGEAETVEVVAERPMMHGIALDGDTAFLMTVNDVFRTPIAQDGSFGELEEIATGFPEGGQHPNRTLVVGPDDKLYVSVGSTCNACGETNDENATMVRMKKDGSGREIFATGLRNTIGFGFEPDSGELYGLDHGIDWLGDDEQPEELNHIQQGKKYGWPYVYADSQLNPQDEPPEGTIEEWADASTEPVLMYTPHAAPMQMDFYTGTAFPEAYRGDAFAAMRGSWNRKPPSGYEIVRIRFEDGQPQAFESFISGFLSEEEGSWQQMGRLAGLAAGPDGALYFSDDTNGVVYQVTYDGGEAGGGAAGAPDQN